MTETVILILGTAVILLVHAAISACQVINDELKRELAKQAEVSDDQS